MDSINLTRMNGPFDGEKHIAELEAEIERLRGLLAQFVSDNYERFPSLPFAEQIAPPDILACRFCESEWELGTQDRHTDDCPVTLARTALEHTP